MTRIGVIFEIPLSYNRKAYGQYILRDRMGPLIKVFNLIAVDQPNLDAIINSDLLFPPIFTGLFAALKTGYWKKIGFSNIRPFEYPGFVSTFENEITGEASIWFYWNGQNSIRLGYQLPDAYKNKEYLMVWDPHDVVHRIETGECPFPYKELILYNKYTPRRA